MSATFEVTKQEFSEIEDGRAVYLGYVRFPDHVDHDPEGEDLLDENDQPVLLEFEISVYMPQDDEERETAMQAYADDYQQGYWQSVADGHRGEPTE